MNYEDYVKIVDHIAILIALILFLLIKFLKYRNSNEKIKLKKESLSVFNSPSISVKPIEN